ncbi:MAG: hypothetical protein K2P99_00930 [Burkholderiales bacterium]|nr:hypothetical protein [Burkholderiales bacterium]
MKVINVESIKQEFNKFIQRTPDYIHKINDFVIEQKELFYVYKKDLYESQGLEINEAINKIRQGWVSTVGGVLEGVIEVLIGGFCKQFSLSITNDKSIKAKNRTKELDLVYRNVVIHFGEYAVLPDGDIIIYQYNEIPEYVKIIAILSIKNSFRERYTETPYWKLKLQESEVTKSIKVMMITPDADNEISIIKNKAGIPTKSRIVLEYELDGVYIAKSPDEILITEKIKSLGSLITDLEDIVKGEINVNQK